MEGADATEILGGIKARAPRPHEYDCDAGESESGEEEEGFGWGLKKAERLPQAGDDDGGGSGNITFAQGLNCKTDFPHRQRQC